MTMLEQARADAENAIREDLERRHRALDLKYNLLRVSERRWRIVRVSSTAAVSFGVPDVITFEWVTDPLPFEHAIEALRERRGGRS